MWCWNPEGSPPTTCLQETARTASCKLLPSSGSIADEENRSHLGGGLRQNHPAAAPRDQPLDRHRPVHRRGESRFSAGLRQKSCEPETPSSFFRGGGDPGTESVSVDRGEGWWLRRRSSGKLRGSRRHSGSTPDRCHQPADELRVLAARFSFNGGINVHGKGFDLGDGPGHIVRPQAAGQDQGFPRPQLMDK